MVMQHHVVLILQILISFFGKFHKNMTTFKIYVVIIQQQKTVSQIIQSPANILFDKIHTDIATVLQVAACSV